MAGDTNDDHAPGPLGPRSNIPIPDPSLRTTEALIREVEHLRELVQSEIRTVEERLERFTHNHEEKHRDVVETAVEHLGELLEARLSTIEVKFGGVQTQFAERDTRTEQALRSSTDAIGAAMAAQEKAIAKSELATAKQIEDLRTTFAAQAKGLEDKLDDVKDRVVRAEGSLTGEEKSAAGMSTGVALAISALGLLIGLIIAGLAIAAAVGGGP